MTRVPAAWGLRPTARAASAALAVLLALALAGCGSSTETMQKKLERISSEDLHDIIGEIPQKARSSMLGKPYFKVDYYREFHGDSAIVFQAMATVVFFYLDPSLDLCQVRKYRYKTTAGMWDRYQVDLVHFPAKYSGSEGQ